GSLRAPPVLEALGSDQEYQAWARTQPCVVCGGYDYDPDTGVQQNEFAHVRRANNSGTSLKPEWSGVPMCHQHHHVQHNQGEVAAYLEQPGFPEGDAEVAVDTVKDWFNSEVSEHLERWAHEKMRSLFEVDHLKHVPPEQIADWFHHHDLAPYLPRRFEY
ncbi:MAG TPA: hypothetical protein VKA48_00120, partial [Gammaproteobacteria bacterium]|nr:hypothetical protein [Gammaproteobacteria bacterium]